MDVPQTWNDRIALNLGVDDADALNDETFGDGGDWDEPDPVQCFAKKFIQCVLIDIGGS